MSTNNNVVVEYRDLSHALATWRATANRGESWDEVRKVIDNLVDQLGDPIRLHTPAGDGYIAMTFAKEPTKIGAYINSGFIDCIVETHGATRHESKSSYWRTLLSTWREISSSLEKGSAAEVALCPDCFINIPITGACGCGWRPSNHLDQ